MSFRMFSVAVLLSLSASMASAQVPHIIGTWKLNVERSDINGPPPQYEVRQYYERDDGFLVGIATIINADGNPNVLQFTTKTDGRDSPLYDVPTLAELQVSGTESPINYTESRVGERTIRFVDSRDGELRVTGSRTVSEDGQTMTVSVVPAGQSRDNPSIYVYERQ